ncbi:carbohydrate kinase [Sphingobacterium sp. SGG-5]|uniref:carbohydrate kinase family protein n=1 Tax=Sphingobacterium sp. SGG-5 TaxID=2710881 RepID=UPI0013ECFA66|nr:carbohydrate kinase [Sphingobacterium sp. SGG-5]NGM61762.1 carbohydrate kinase [Sphingobacterium sp. SGG-5]
MVNEKQYTKVLCIGELLWDMIPTGKAVGGAPFNVAYHLNKLGVHTKILTRIGKDRDGVELLDFLGAHAIDTSMVQVDEQQSTSKVEVYYDDTHAIKYNIVYPTAWDFLASPDPSTGWADTDYLVFGSLIFRHSIAKKAVLDVLKRSQGIKIFDINLRAPHFSKESVLELLAYTDILKLNEDELALVSEWLGTGDQTISLQTDHILDTFGIKELVLTLGERGAMHKSLDKGETYFCQAQKVDVVDTIGSGDSFLAAFIASRIEERPIREALHIASVLAAFVTSRKGGCPEYTRTDLDYFEWHNGVL